MRKNKLRKILQSFRDAMNPDCKAASAALTKIFALNNKSDLIPYAKLDNVRKQLKANDIQSALMALNGAYRAIDLNEMDNKVLNAETRVKEASAGKESLKDEKRLNKARRTYLTKIQAGLDLLSGAPEMAAAKRAAKALFNNAVKLREFAPMLEKSSKKVLDLITTGKDSGRSIGAVQRALKAAEKAADKAEKKTQMSERTIKIDIDKAKDALKIAKMRSVTSDKERLAIVNLMKTMKKAESQTDIEERVDAPSSVSNVKLESDISELKNKAAEYNKALVGIYNKRKKVLDALLEILKGFDGNVLVFNNTPAIRPFNKYYKMMYVEGAVKSLNDKIDGLMDTAPEASVYLKNAIKKNADKISDLDRIFLDIQRDPRKFQGSIGKMYLESKKQQEKLERKKEKEKLKSLEEQKEKENKRQEEKDAKNVRKEAGMRGKNYDIPADEYPRIIEACDDGIKKWEKEKLHIIKEANELKKEAERGGAPVTKDILNRLFDNFDKIDEKEPVKTALFFSARLFGKRLEDEDHKRIFGDFPTKKKTYSMLFSNVMNSLYRLYFQTPEDKKAEKPIDVSKLKMGVPIREQHHLNDLSSTDFSVDFFWPNSSPTAPPAYFLSIHAEEGAKPTINKQHSNDPLVKALPQSMIENAVKAVDAEYKRRIKKRK